MKEQNQNLPDQPSGPPQAEPYCLKVEGLTVRFGRNVAIENLNFTCLPGSWTAVIGPNGSGKSTLLKAILGLVDVDHGSIELSCTETGIGYVPQAKTLDRRFPATVVELVSTGLKPRWPFRIPADVRKKVEACLERVGLRGYSKHLLSDLSGGELQRVYLARSLIRSPALVILDEPATGLDRSGETDMYELLDQLRKEQGATILMVTHDLDAAYHHATHVLIMNRTTIAAGRPDCLTQENLKAAFGHSGHEHPVGLLHH